jgi:hypothetical protein
MTWRPSPALRVRPLHTVGASFINGPKLENEASKDSRLRRLTSLLLSIDYVLIAVPLILRNILYNAKRTILVGTYFDISHTDFMDFSHIREKNTLPQGSLEFRLYVPYRHVKRNRYTQ